MEGLERLIGEALSFPGRVVKVKDVAGGIVNEAAVYQLEEESTRTVFVKHSKRENAFDMFQAEKVGLHLLTETQCIKTPVPHKVVRTPRGGALFLMEYLDGLEPLHSHWEKLGQQMAKLHMFNLDCVKRSKLMEGYVGESKEDSLVRKFGFSMKTFFGPNFSVPPIWTDTWQEYYICHLLKPLFEEIGKDNRDIRELWSVLQLHVHRLFDGFDLKPSLVHGDFCTINVGQLNEDTVLFDPCPLYAPAEFDLTIPYMENNFPQEFFNAYHSIVPKTKGFDRLIKTNLLFGHLLCYSHSEDSQRLAAEIGNELLHLTLPK